jgi:hypothetical protein
MQRSTCASADAIAEAIELLEERCDEFIASCERRLLIVEPCRVLAAGLGGDEQ